MAHVIIVGPPRSLEQFRGDLIVALVAMGHRVTTMYAEADPEQVERLRVLGAAFRAFPVERNAITPLSDLKTYLALRRAYDEEQPDVVLAYTIKAVIWSGFALRGMPDTRFVALINGLGFTFQGKGLFRRLLTRTTSALYRRALTRAEAVVFQNKDNCKTFVDRQIADKTRCHVVNGSGVDLDRFAYVPLQDGSPTFLLVARLLGEKGLREYAAAARMVKTVYPAASFQLLGPVDQSLDAVPLREVQAWQQEGVVDYLGSAVDVRPYLAACHVFVLPSYHEGLPRSVLEAMATGRPILTTDVPGCRETVVPGLNGILVPKADASRLAEQLLWLVANRTCWATMGLQSRRLAEEVFDVRKVNAHMVRLLGFT